ncbi:MAG: Peptidase C39 family protein [Deltaproteobacteria bacterium ADurb.Bin510]|jgi:hypothetical protein|nr:MAG: Peptidase C39 family protein [Deltaproteobacteria bacterium ADurb.Bin510]
MRASLKLEIQPQPDETSCGPTCLQAVYGYYGDAISLERVQNEVPMLNEGGTLAVHLANHALRRGYLAGIYSYNLMVFDPSWAKLKVAELKAKLAAQAAFKQDPKLALTTEAYCEFLDLGGRLYFDDLAPGLIRAHLKQDRPLIAGLCATYLYQSPREYGSDYDDIRGEASGHFVVLSGYNRRQRTVQVADPYEPNPFAHGLYYEVSLKRLIGAIFLGVLSYDAKLLVIEPRS